MLRSHALVVVCKRQRFDLMFCVIEVSAESLVVYVHPEKKSFLCGIYALPPVFVLFFVSSCGVVLCGVLQEKEFVVPDEMTKYRLCEIEDGGHFFVHDVEGGDLAKIEAKLKELKDKVTSQPALPA